MDYYGDYFAFVEFNVALISQKINSMNGMDYELLKRLPIAYQFTIKRTLIIRSFRIHLARSKLRWKAPRLVSNSRESS